VGFFAGTRHCKKRRLINTGLSIDVVLRLEFFFIEAKIDKLRFKLGDLFVDLFKLFEFVDFLFDFLCELAVLVVCPRCSRSV